MYVHSISIYFSHANVNHIIRHPQCQHSLCILLPYNFCEQIFQLWNFRAYFLFCNMFLLWLQYWMMPWFTYTVCFTIIRLLCEQKSAWKLVGFSMPYFYFWCLHRKCQDRHDVVFPWYCKTHCLKFLPILVITK